MMENVALQSTLASQIAIPGYRIADKTGTGEIAENGVYKRDDALHHDDRLRAGGGSAVPRGRHAQ